MLFEGLDPFRAGSRENIEEVSRTIDIKEIRVEKDIMEDEFPEFHWECLCSGTKFHLGSGPLGREDVSRQGISWEC